MEYTDIHILECNKKQSIGAGDINSNNSIFTNKLGKVVQLNQGDKVNVEYSFINEKGCGADTIEIEGKELGTESIFTYTEDTTPGLFRSIDIRDGGDQPVYPTLETLTREQIIKHTQKTTTKMLRDDEVNIEQHFYKSTNAEGYFFLPRRFLTSDALFNDSDSSTIWTTQHSQPRINQHGTDPAPQGACGVFLSNDKCICRADYTKMPRNLVNTNPTLETYAWVPRNDGAKYTIFCRDVAVYDISYNNDEYESIIHAWSRLSPAYRKYNLYTQLDTIKVDKGYNSPANISTKITQQLQEETERKEYYVADRGAVKSKKRLVTESRSTTTYKEFNAVCQGNFGESLYDSWILQSNPAVQKDAIYETSYEFVGCKRPMISVYGRALAENVYNASIIDQAEYLNEMALIRNQINIADAKTSHIVTSWEWNDTNINLLRNLFKEQIKYPELFEDMPEAFKYYTEDATTYTRDFTKLGFLHTNKQDIDTSVGNLGGVAQYQDWLGDDGYRSDNLDPMNPLDFYSIPVFFHVDYDNIDVEDTGENNTRLNYGFCSKSDFTGAGPHFIVLHPELSGGLSEWVTYNFNYGKNLLGFDCSFSAYSSMFIGLSSGYLNWGYEGSTEYGEGRVGHATFYNVGGGVEDGHATPYHPQMTFTGYQINKCYLGSPNSALEFLSNGHYAFNYLHDPERKGQPYNAGIGGALPVTIDAAAGSEVFKINKLTTTWSFCPDITPYHPDGTTLSYDGTETPPPGSKPADFKTKVFDLLNWRIIPGSIMDAHGGVFLNLGKAYTKDTFKDGLLGILGFTWEQFNPTEVNQGNNKQSRIDYKNQYKLDNWITTNCDTLATENKDFILNIYGAVMNTTQLPTALCVLGWEDWASPGEDPALPDYWIKDSQGYTLYPIINELTSSINVGADSLPKKMLKPYFTIRSDIVTDNKYIGGNETTSRSKGGGISLPVIAVVNKQNGDGDFYFSSESPLEFTITKPTSFSSITTSIHEPDNRLANVGEECCIIYKITRMRTQDPDIMQEILGNISTKKKSKSNL